MLAKNRFFHPHTTIIITTLIIVIFFQFFFLEHVKLFVQSDSAIYAILADRFANGQWNTAFHIWWQPFFPAIAGLLKFFVGDTLLALYSVSFLANALLIVPVYFLGYKITGRKYWSILTAFFVATNFYLVTSIPTLLTENLYIFLLASAIAMFSFYFYKQRKLFLIGAAIFFGCSYLTRSEGLLFFILSAGYLLTTLAVKGNYKKMISSILVFCLTFLIIISPYLIFTYNVFHGFHFSAKSNASLTMPRQFALDQTKTSTFAQDVWSIDTFNYTAPYFFKSPHIIENFSSFLHDASIRSHVYFRQFYFFHGLLFITILLLVLKGIHFLMYNKKSLYLTYILVIGGFLLLLFIPQAETRYVFWAIPLLFLHASLGLYSIVKAFPKRIYYSSFILLTLILSYLLVNSYQNRIPTQYIPNGQKYQIIGEYLSKNQHIDSIMNRVEAYSYYSGKKMVYTPNINVTLAELHAYMQHWKVDRLIADADTLARDPFVSNLLDEKQKPDWLEVDKVITVNGEKIIIYKMIY